MTMLVKQRIQPGEVKMELVGNVEGKECLIVDDLIDSGVFFINSYTYKSYNY